MTKSDKKNLASWRGQVRRVWRRILWSVAALLLLSLVLLGLYSVPFIRPVSTLMIKDGLLGHAFQRQWVSLDTISPYLINAVLMSEDGRFCSHYGVDWQALHGEVMRDGGPARGASTLTMQTVKNLFLWHGRAYLRKGLEIPLALAANMILSKKRQMEIYLNIAEWGPNIYGAEAAAQFYFKRSSAQLTPRQGALLAVALPNPYLRNPAKPSAALNRLSRLVQNRAERSGAYIGCLK